MQKSIYSQRIKAVAENMKEQAFSQIIVTSPASVFYLSGIWVQPYERMLALCLNDGGEAALCANALFGISQSQLGCELINHSDSDDPIAGLAALIKPGNLGIDKSWQARFYIPLASKLSSTSISLGSSPVDEARMAKGNDEIELMKLASKINDQVMAYIISAASEGISESECYSLVCKAYTELGADEPIGEQIIAFGENAADAHHSVSKRSLRSGDCALFDLFAPVNRYWADMSRTAFLHTASNQAQDIYGIVKQAQQAAADLAKPGVPLAEIDRAARGIIEKAGFADQFTHRLGHGIGLEEHEPPDVSALSTEIARKGMIFSIEPGIYIGENYAKLLPMGVRIEDLILITEGGSESLNSYTKELQIL
ncbi:MAG: Xaa-Pro peptidase family protein [Eubacteriaceae bacterium]|jgi:Xaa-Pro dipeptidase|nr:Xaa-Pro peptidase family protein [Eubacteriaceae bacterium]